MQIEDTREIMVQIHSNVRNLLQHFKSRSHINIIRKYIGICSNIFIGIMTEKKVQFEIIIATST